SQPRPDLSPLSLHDALPIFAEVESALVLHEKVAEAAVVGFPHDIKGQGIYAYVTLVAGEQESEELRRELIKQVRTEIGPTATPRSEEHTSELQSRENLVCRL